MVKYPQNIADAVRILDNYDKKWAEKIDVNVLNMGEYDECVLGQLFRDSVQDGQVGYEIGMKDIFGINTEDDDDAVYTNDNIFGAKASKNEWIKEVRKRVKEKTYTVKIKGKNVKFTQSEVNSLYDTLDPITGR